MDFKTGHTLKKQEQFQTNIKPAKKITTRYITLDVDGLLILKVGFWWNGANFIIDRKSNYRGSAAHDALYDLIKLGLLPYDLWPEADKEYVNILKEDGKWWGISWLVRTINGLGLKIGNGRDAMP